MIFSSPIFLFIFLPAVLALYYFCRVELRNIILLIASLTFYFWGEPKYLVLIIGLTVCNFMLGWCIESINDRKIKKVVLIISILVNFGSLFYFKYYNFAIDNINLILDAHVKNKNILLPLGISFFIFQIMSYVIDVYRKEVKAQKSLSKLALYITLFPQLIAGPIVRYIDIEKQINRREINSQIFYEGCRRFCIGFSKKILIADQMAIIADFAFSNKLNDSFTAWVGIVAYSLQIYFDFSGYSDMAIGLGKMFGFNFLENFNYPYVSCSIKEFWRRWHISLSTWFRDYVYIPLGGNRCSQCKACANLIVVFLFTGLWHGASWNFVIWGLWYVVFLIIENYGFSDFLDKVPNCISRFYSLLVILIGWVFFRAETLDKAIEYLKVMFSFNQIHNSNFFIVMGLVFSTPIVDFFKEKLEVYDFKLPIVDIGLLVVFSVSILYMVGSGFSPFLYFRF